MSSMRIRAALVAVLALALVGRSTAAEPTVGTFDAKGVKIRYVEQGTGEPVVLIHGLAATAYLNWQIPGIFAALAKDHRVIALDLPGHGGSDKPEKPEVYGAQMAEDVVLLMDHLDIKKAHVVGYSLGGMITVKLLTLHPDRVLSATVGGMGWVKDSGRNMGLREGMPVREGASSLGFVVASLGKLAVTEEAIKSVKVPVTVIIGEQDGLNQRTVMPLRQVRPDWPVVEVKGAGHMSCIWNKEFRNALVAWLDKNRQK
jgi:pimeloyl-ACP methyl ester carboxylesterase